MIKATFDKGFPASPDPDIRNVQRTLEGELDAFEVLYHKYFSKINAVCRGVLNNPDDAVEIAVETFHLAYKNLSKFDRRSSFVTWLTRIAVNRSIQEARKQYHRQKTVSLEVAEYVLAEETSSSNGNDNAPAIHKALQHLNPADRAVMTMFYWQDLSLQEIAQALNSSPNAVKTRLYRARDRFKQVYQGEIPE